MYKIIKTLLASVLLAVSVGANANLISVELDNTSYSVGDNIVANIYFSDIEQDSFGQIALAAFEFDLSFDDSLIAFDSILFGDGLDLGINGSEQNFSQIGSILTVEEVSWEFSGLEAIQAPSFLLASVSFTALQVGEELLSITPQIFSDMGGSSGVFDVIDVSNRSVIVTGGPVSVPEPTALSLFACGLMLLVGRISRR